MKRRKMIAKFMVLMLWMVIISFSVDLDAGAAEDKVVNTIETMDINEYRMNKENTLTRKFNSGIASANYSSPKNLIMDEIKRGLNNLQRSINLDNYIEYFKSTSDAQVPLNYFFDTLNENPEIFYANLTIKCSYSYNKSTNEIMSYNLLVTYQYDDTTINDMKNKFNEKVNYIKENYLSKGKSDLEKEYIIHDYIVENCRYDYENLDNLPTVDHTSYGSLVNGLAVCDGYSKGAKVLFNLCDIESGIVDSERMNHAWNYVNINGEYYNLDITWDDNDIDNYIDYSYFNISNKDMSSGDNPHIWNSSNYPSCISEDFNFLRNGQIYIRDGEKLYTIEGLDEIYSSDLDGNNYMRKLVEDLNDDNVVDMLDISLIANSYNSIIGQATYNTRYDLNSDGIIDIYDITRISYKVIS